MSNHAFFTEFTASDMSHSTAIVWFRQDLRLADNPALANALAQHKRIIPVYIHAPAESHNWAHGAASNWWLHHSLLSLDTSLRQLGSRLVMLRGDNSHALLNKLIDETGATQIYWNRLYEPAHIERDKNIKQDLRERGLEVSSFNSSLLNEPWQMTKADGTPYHVFTPYWKACVKAGLPTGEHECPDALPTVDKKIKSVKLEALELLPRIHWDAAFAKAWQPGERGAHAQLENFLTDAAADYKIGRDHPDTDGTSMLSPHLHFGEISPRQIVDETSRYTSEHTRAGLVANTEVFIREIGWREFACHLLYHYPQTVDKPLHTRFEKFRWEKNYHRNLRAWQQGRTGIPFVDAGMRQLWHTGWMHNRVRMIVASLLTKNMLIPWQEGSKWFWDTLVDADLASNTLGWQWVAGCGADAAPYFRIFNPVTQSQKFDPGGIYIRRWIPEIASLPDKYLHQPWTAPADVLSECGIKLGTHYPKPVVDLKTTRERALERFKATKNQANKKAP